MTTETRTHSYRRFWRRLSSPRPLWPLGWLLLLGLLLLFLYGAFVLAPHIERDVADQVFERLDGNAVVNATVDTDGQRVAVAATAPESATVAIHALAKSTQCGTWVGELTCPTRVQVNLAAPPAAPVAPRPHDFVFTRTANGVTLTGEVANASTRDRVVAFANARFDAVIDELRVSDERATDSYVPAAERSLWVLQALKQGNASWTDTELNASGVAMAEKAVVEARSRFNEQEGAPQLGEIDVRFEITPRLCDRQFARLLKQSSIRFRTASADIETGNEVLLASLAKLAAECPGGLSIEGHTDSRGAADMNQALSLARASSVRDALIELGINGTRLVATGYGEARPIADNNTIAGRAQNRRIVISSQTANQTEN